MVSMWPPLSGPKPGYIFVTIETLSPLTGLGGKGKQVPSLILTLNARAPRRCDGGPRLVREKGREIVILGVVQL